LGRCRAKRVVQVSPTILNVLDASPSATTTVADDRWPGDRRSALHRRFDCAKARRMPDQVHAPTHCIDSLDTAADIE
jgi:hypothetical protein